MKFKKHIKRQSASIYNLVTLVYEKEKHWNQSSYYELWHLWNKCCCNSFAGGCLRRQETSWLRDHLLLTIIAIKKKKIKTNAFKTQQSRQNYFMTTYCRQAISVHHSIIDTLLSAHAYKANYVHLKLTILYLQLYCTSHGGQKCLQHQTLES